MLEGDHLEVEHRVLAGQVRGQRRARPPGDRDPSRGRMENRRRVGMRHPFRRRRRADRGSRELRLWKRERRRVAHPRSAFDGPPYDHAICSFDHLAGATMALVAAPHMAVSGMVPRTTPTRSPNRPRRVKDPSRSMNRTAVVVPSGGRGRRLESSRSDQRGGAALRSSVGRRRQGPVLEGGPAEENRVSGRSTGRSASCQGGRASSLMTRGRGVSGRRSSRGPRRASLPRPTVRP